MGKYIIIIALILSGCSDFNEIDSLEKNRDTYVSKENSLVKEYRIICLDGIEYYSSRYNTSVKIDKLTLKPKRCR